MATIQEIKKEITEAFMQDERVKEKWGLLDNDTFEDRFKTASVENLLFYIVATIIYIREKAHYMWQKDVEETAMQTRYGTKQWWWKQAMMWQKDDMLEVNSDGELQYSEENESKRIIKYAAVQNNERTVYIKVAKEENEELVQLTEQEVEQLQGYLEQIKPLGIMVRAQSLNACTVRIDSGSNIYYNAQKDKESVKEKVREAIKEYLQSVAFGGVIFKQKLVDAIQEVDGVEDVEIKISVEDNGGTSNIARVYEAKGGYYKLAEGFAQANNPLFVAETIYN